MKKIAIVGVEGSGKTVMMAAMGEQWERPDERGYFLSPENAEAFGFSKSVMAILRSGRWPNASSHDEMRTLAWSLQRRQGGNLEKIADISMLDYAGEVYRQAFGGEKREGYDEQVATLRSHVDEADVLIVLVNLSDVISGSMSNRRTRDAMWLTKSVLDYALQGKSQKPHAAIVFTQADSYREIISANGGTAAALKKYLPHVANLYGDLPIFTASAIDHTVIGADGLPIPASDFNSTGLDGIVNWMIQIGEADRRNGKMREEICKKEKGRVNDKALITDSVPLVHLGYMHSYHIQARYSMRGLGWLLSIRMSIIVLLLAIASCWGVLNDIKLITFGKDIANKNIFYGFAYGISVPLFLLACLLRLMRKIRTYNVLEYFSKGQWHKAMKYNKLVCDGDGGILYYQAISFLFGFGGTTIDNGYAACLFQQSAKCGVGEALVGLGWMAEQGLGMPQSFDRAKQYYDEARSMGAKGVPEINVQNTEKGDAV